MGRERLVARRDESAISEPAEVLGGKEREAPRRAKRTRRTTAVGGTNRLRGVLDHGDAVARGQLDDRIHVGA